MQAQDIQIFNIQHKFLLTKLLRGALQDLSIDKQATVAYLATNPLSCNTGVCLCMGRKVSIGFLFLCVGVGQCVFSYFP